ncbi:unnamed protein product [Diabrotica balteata]|uniref:Uncharacterized protein n=1 Tax=Diabrotica balteata TaxID=107213 RepID=A0A9N9SM83_DIABA|nr:unnamed protein product [Diabrotica balteata]
MFNQMINLWEEKTKAIKSFVGDSYYYPFTNPIINEKVEDRICGWGPSLEFYLNKDIHLAKKKSDLVDYFRKNYDTAFSYLRRYQSIREFYADDILVKNKDIENERGESIRNL